MSKGRVVVDLRDRGITSFVGRDNGEALRTKYDLDSVDSKQQFPVRVIFPDQTTTITSSYFLGLFYKSIKTAGSKSKFYDRYEFQAPDHIMSDIDVAIEDGLMDA